MVYLGKEKRNKASCIDLFLEGIAEVCFGYIQDTSKAGGQCKHQTFMLTLDDKMPTLRKIKRAASRHTSQRFCSTFNFTQPHPKPTHHPNE